MIDGRALVECWTTELPSTHTRGAEPAHREHRCAKPVAAVAHRNLPFPGQLEQLGAGFPQRSVSIARSVL